MMELEVHLHEGFLHMLDVCRRILDEPFPVAQVGPKTGDVRARAEAGSQKPELMQLLKPLGVVVIGLPSGYLFYFTGIHQDYLETVGFKDFKDRDPVDTGGFHCDRGDPYVTQPSGEPVEIGGEALELPHGKWITFGRHGNDVERGPNIDAGGMRMNNGEFVRTFFRRHKTSSTHELGGGMKRWLLS
jgi:hypothetical protein